jgi:hypothetical protein
MSETRPARIWTVDELTRVHPLPDGWEWAHDDSVGWYAHDNNGATVCVDYCGDLLALWNGTTIISPCADVCLAVILASKGLDSYAAMVVEADREAAEWTTEAINPVTRRLVTLGREALNRTADMLRRGTVAG